jgi:hypothetical protein
MVNEQGNEQEGKVNMPDISMCMEGKCDKKKLCKRSEESGTIPDRFQAWTTFNTDQEQECDFFIPISDVNYD